MSIIATSRPAKRYSLATACSSRRGPDTACEWHRVIWARQPTMRNERYDVVILGGGNAGIGVTVATHKAGKSVALIESWVLGGTCPNRGCTPKKVLVAAGHSLHE